MPAQIARHPIVEALFKQQGVALGLLDRDLRYLRVNAALAAMNGAPVEAHVGRTVRELWPPETAEGIEALAAEVFAGRAIVDLETRVETLAGMERVFTLSYLPIEIGGEVVAILGMLVDVTAREQVEVELAGARQRLVLALEGTGTGTFEYEVDTGALRWSDNLGPLYGRPRGWAPADYDEYVRTIHPDDREMLAADVRRAAAEGRGYEREFRAVLPDGSVRWRASRVHVLGGGAAAPRVLIGMVQDIEARKRRERRSELLARAGLALGESLDVSAVLQHIAQLAVGELGDWCWATLAEPDGELRSVAVAGADAERVEAVREFRARYPTDPDAPTATAEVVRTGRSLRDTAVADALLVAVAGDDDHLALLRSLEIHSLLVAPIVGRGETLGAMTFAFAQSSRPHDEDDQALAEELGRRAGLAIENARLYGTVRRTAITLQRSLLPSGLPDIPGWQVAARYLPGEAGAAVGGDWYDVFPLRSGAFALVVGDVMGRGIPAAAGMGRLRSALQAHLYDTWDAVEALARLDDLVADLRVVPFATVLAVVLEPGTGDVSLCTAGHPPPMLRGADGPRLLEMVPGPPVGSPMGPRRPTLFNLAPGEAMLLYTDGLVEARDATLDERFELLRSVLQDAPVDPSALLDHALAGMLGPSMPDDVAVVGVRRLPTP